MTAVQFHGPNGVVYTRGANGFDDETFARLVDSGFLTIVEMPAAVPVVELDEPAEEVGVTEVVAPTPRRRSRK